MPARTQLQTKPLQIFISLIISYLPVTPHSSLTDDGPVDLLQPIMARTANSAIVTTSDANRY